MNNEELNRLEADYFQSDDPTEALERVERDLMAFNDCYEEEGRGQKDYIPSLCDDLLSELDKLAYEFSCDEDLVKSEIAAIEDAEKRVEATQQCKDTEKKLKTDQADFKEIIQASDEVLKNQSE